MKKFFRTAAIAALFAGVLSTGVVYAQRGFGPNATSGSGTVDTATLVANRVAHLTNLLDLTSAQAAQATSIFTSQINASTTLRTTLDTAHTNLQTAVKSNATATIDQLATSIGTLQGQLLALDAKADAAFYALLTSAQQTRFGSLHGGGFGPGGRGGHGGHRP